MLRLLQVGVSHLCIRRQLSPHAWSCPIHAGWCTRQAIAASMLQSLTVLCVVAQGYAQGKPYKRRPGAFISHVAAVWLLGIVVMVGWHIATS